MYTSNACEYVFHGREAKQQCCPHGITRPAAPINQCCVDDLPITPYRLQYIDHVPTTASTTYTFGIQIVAVSDWDNDGTITTLCNMMSLDYAQLQICACLLPASLALALRSTLTKCSCPACRADSGVNVSQVTFQGRILPFNYTTDTSYAKWLNILDINQFYADFNANDTYTLEVVFDVSVYHLQCPDALC
jgi:hypothetical protein